MPTSETRTQASMTMPLSSTRSRTSMRLLLPAARSTPIRKNSPRWPGRAARETQNFYKVRANSVLMATCALGVGETGLRVGKTFPIFDGQYIQGGGGVIGVEGGRGRAARRHKDTRPP